jgi:aspartyl protease family protein
MRIRGFFLALCIASPAAHATDVTMIGLFPGKAVITVNRGAPRTLAVGEATAEGVKLVATKPDGAVFEIDGKRETLEMGQHFESAALTGARDSVSLPMAGNGHFVADALVNGAPMRFLVDTGATLVSISAADAAKVGIDYRKGRPMISTLADGRQVKSYHVVLDSVSVGGITIFNVDGSVRESGGPALLGMSFLGRTEMRQDGQSMTLTKRY